MWERELEESRTRTYAVKYQCPTTPATTTLIAPLATAQLHNHTSMTTAQSVPAQLCTCQTQACSEGGWDQYPRSRRCRARERKGIDAMKQVSRRSRERSRIEGCVRRREVESW